MVKGSFYHNIRKFLPDFPDLEYNGTQVVCVPCNRALCAIKRSTCKRHVLSATHKLKKNGQNRYTQFILDLLIMLCSCNVPLYIVDKKPFLDFWQRFTSWKLPSRSMLQRHLPSMRDRLDKTIISELHNKRLWLAMGKITDPRKHSVVNIIVRSLDPLHQSSAHLLASKRIKNCTTEALTNLILTTLQTFHIATHQVLLFLSDGAPIMLRTGYALKAMCPNLLHITCLLHTLDLTVERVRKCYPHVNALIANTKAIFAKSPKHIREFHKQCPGVPKPPVPILTRQGTWLKTVFYYVQYFSKIKSLVLQFDDKDSAAIQKCQLNFQDVAVETDLKIIHSNYSHLSDAITKLQNPSLTLDETLQTIDNVQNLLHNLNDEHGIRVTEEFNSGIKKNPDFARVRHIFSCSTDMDLLYMCRTHLTFANMTCLDVERSFSLYKNILTPQRSSLTERTVETFAMLQVRSGQVSKANPDLLLGKPDIMANSSSMSSHMMPEIKSFQHMFMTHSNTLNVKKSKLENKFMVKTNKQYTLDLSCDGKKSGSFQTVPGCSTVVPNLAKPSTNIQNSVVVNQSDQMYNLNYEEWETINEELDITDEDLK